MHAALETLFGLPAAERVPQKAVDLVLPSWERILAEAPDLIDLVPEDQRDTFLDEARSLVTAYYELEDPTRFEAESCEQRVETELADGVLLRGFVDRIDVAPLGRFGWSTTRPAVHHARCPSPRHCSR